MKRFAISYLLISLSIGANATNTTDFTTLYPNVARFYNAVITTKAFLNHIAGNSGIISANNQMIKALNDGKGIEFIKVENLGLQNESNCLANFANSFENEKLQTEILAEIPASELQAMETFNQTSSGQKMSLAFEQMIETTKVGDMESLDKIKGIITKEDEQKIKAFAKQHEALLTDIDKIIDSKQANTLYRKYQQSCKIETINL